MIAYRGLYATGARLVEGLPRPATGIPSIIEMKEGNLTHEDIIAFINAKRRDWGIKLFETKCTEAHIKIYQEETLISLCDDQGFGLKSKPPVPKKRKHDEDGEDAGDDDADLSGLFDDEVDDDEVHCFFLFRCL